MTRSLLITGCSSGIGYCCAHGMKARGWRVFATARKAEDIARLRAEGLETFYLDYTEPESIAACVAAVAAETGGTLDGLFNNGTYGQPGAVEDLPVEALRAQFESGFFGWHDLARRCTGLMRANGTGRIVQNSSVLGLAAMKGRGAYNAMKFALEGLSDTMRLELRPHNIHVVLIEPGPITSRFTEHALAAFERHIDEHRSRYAATYRLQRERLASGGTVRFKLPPEAVLAKLVKALESPRPKIRYYVTTPTHIMAWSKRLLPMRLFDALVDKVSEP